MIWPRVSKTAKKKLPGKSYRGWKEILAEEGSHQCVYCGIPEARFGGTWNFHVEHFKPKSLFEELENDYGNLFYSCAICNVHKGDHWPGEPKANLGSKTFVEPTKHDYNTLFVVSTSGHVKGIRPATAYMVERIFLNRPQLINERKMYTLKDRIRACQATIEILAKEALTKRSKEIQVALAKALLEVMSVTRLEDKILTARPYSRSEVSRQ